MSDATGTVENAVEIQHGCPVQDSHGQRVLHASRDQYVSVIKALADEGYEMCVDLTGADYLAMPHRTIGFGIQPERFELVVNLLSLSQRKRIRLRVQVPADDVTMPTLFDIHPGTEAHERETFDMFGIVFIGHPDMTRILMPEDWDGHPLRKDYSQGAIPVQFKGAHS
ncbi:MAG: NADH-quinone oxidoreductase subunit C [Acidimicrobium sp.]|nr:NADH-quinone oxidoreductase subunit C [Ilumatobacteraceae bacterium]PHX70862.1 MAG: NADH-quinone oxidoreductase subunit C [Acidimicrobium sp.]